MEWARLLAYITGTVDQELLLRNEYLAAENPPGVGEGHARRSPSRDLPPAVGSRIQSFPRFGGLHHRYAAAA
jgi:hypothetical protein